MKVYITKQKRQTMKPALLAHRNSLTSCRRAASQNLTESALCEGVVFGLIFHNGRCERRGFGGGENCRANMIGCRSKHHENIIPNFSASRNSNFNARRLSTLIDLRLFCDDVENSVATADGKTAVTYSISFPIPRDAVRSEIGSNERPQRVANLNRIVEAINRANGKPVNNEAIGHIRQALDKNESRALRRGFTENLVRECRCPARRAEILRMFARACRE